MHQKLLIICLVLLIPLMGNAQEQELVTIFSEGVGKNVEDAVQSAATAALTQVVGTFIDTDTNIEKRKEIRDGIKSQTKTITSKLSEYSQGSIERLDVIEVVEEGSFIRVSAKVTVRIEDFKHYIKETVLAEKKIKKGLLAKLKIKKKQNQSASELVVGKVIKDIYSYQTIVPKIDGEIEEVTDQQLIELINHLVPGDGYVIKIPVKASFKPDFIENARRVLDEVTESRYEGLEVSSVNIDRSKQLYVITMGDLSENSPKTNRRPQYKAMRDMTRRNGYLQGISMRSGSQQFIKNPESMLTYIFPENTVNDLCKATQNLGQSPSRGGYIIPHIKVSFLSMEGNVLRKETLLANDTYNRNLKSSYSFVHPGYDVGTVNNLNYSFGGSTSHVTAYLSRDLHECLVTIDTDTKYSIITKVSEEILSNTDKVVLKYSDPN